MGNIYAFYDVLPCDSYLQMMEIIRRRFEKNIAFEGKNEKWSYLDLYDAVMKCASALSDIHNEYFIVNSEHPFYYTVAYFSVVISGNIAILQSKDSKESYNAIKARIITDAQIKEYLSTITEIKINSIRKSDELCTIAESSGTTSIAKGVMLSQQNLLSDMIGGMQLYHYPENARYYHVIPYTHLFGLVADLMGPLYSGATICFSDYPLNFFEQIQYFKPTNLNLPPVLIEGIWRMLEQTKDINFSTGGNLKKILCAGAKADDKWNELFTEYGFQMYTAYGLTECSPCVTISRDNQWKNGSVGQVLPCCEVKIINGEVAVRGQNVMLGYWQDENATREVKKDGWLFTGDIGYLDSEKFLFLSGRKTNLIVFEDGTKIQPEKIENELSSLTLIRESLVTEIKINNRTLLNVNVVILEKGREKELRQNIKEILKNLDLIQKVKDIYITDQPLMKNKLGKIIRY